MSNPYSKLHALLASGKITPEQYEQMLATLGAGGQDSCQADTNLGERSPFDWLLLTVTFGVLASILLLFTPHTHQLDEIKTALLFTVPPVLLLLALRDLDVSRLTWSRCRPLGLLGLFTLSAFVSVLLGHVNWQMAERVVWFQMACLTFTVVLALMLNTRERLRTAMIVFSGLGLVASVIGVVMYSGLLDNVYQLAKSRDLLPASSWTTLLYVLANGGEMFSTVLSNEFFALFLLMFLSAPLALFLTEEKRLLRGAALATFMLMALCLLLTKVTFAILAACLLSIPLFFAGAFRSLPSIDGARRVRKGLRWGAAAAVLFLAASPFAVRQGLPRVLEFSQAYRVMWRGAVQIWLHGADATERFLNPVTILFGAGPGGFRTLFPLHRQPDFFEYQINNVTTWPHNFYLDLLCEQGLLGLLLFLAFGIVLVRGGVRHMRATADPRLRFYQLAVLSGLAGAALFVAFSPAVRWSVDAAFFWSLIGLSLAISSVSTPHAVIVPAQAEERERSWRRTFVIQTALAALAFLFLFRSVPQGILYYRGAVENAQGLRFMDFADARGVEGEKERQWLRRSIASFERATQLNPTFTTSYYKLGHLHTQLGDTDAAIAAYRNLQTFDPHYSEVHQNLAILYNLKAGKATGAERRKLLETAAEEGRVAAAQSLKPSAQMTTGAVVRELGELVQAEGDRERARLLFEEAKNYYRNVLAFEPSQSYIREERDQHAEKARQALKELEDLTKG